MSNAHLGHIARKRFGQNFLHDDKVIDDIVGAIKPVDGENLVEIGPGLGALTEPVCEAVSKLTVVELDRDLAQRLRSHPFIQNKLNIVEQDALKFNFKTLYADGQLPDSNKPLRVFGNLPYNISTPLMFHLFEFADIVSDMHFMLQLEVVNRLAAAPGHKNYGRLSVMAQYYCKVMPVLNVPPHAFQPPPKVDSAVVRLIPHKTPPVLVSSKRRLDQVCAMGFNQRRKTIRNSLKELMSESEIESVGLDPTVRAETLSLADFAQLANFIENK